MAIGFVPAIARYFGRKEGQTLGGAGRGGPLPGSPMQGAAYDRERSVTPPGIPVLTNEQLCQAWEAETERVAIEDMEAWRRYKPAFEDWTHDIVLFALLKRGGTL